MTSRSWLREKSRDRGSRTSAVLALAVLAGAVGVIAAWDHVHDQRYAAVQTPYLVSGAIGGLALAGTAAAILAIHHGRRLAAGRRAAFEELAMATESLMRGLVEHAADTHVARAKAARSKATRSRGRRSRTG
jgi:hypothetical protein